ncbi:hypothetical protein [Acidipropionibacterium virtanenii]|uniref:Uncharacterized protein n=1 Tax=Acidipropionibacterium virtanenii TaxID=2057246 RepID=A0A344UXH8_9ACTN|nr:hypothetical protein [Acidipropionibacterium virtanenii]AXE39976.1 hypothetical protein JS278_02841 [Acidipropionibacterium virtanenii]
MTPDDNTAGESQDSLTAVSPDERYRAARTAFEALLERDFPDFTVEQYAAEKAAEEGIDRETLADQVWSGVRSVPDRLDVTGDGKIGLDDAQAVAKQAADRIGKTWKRVSGIRKEDVAEATSSAGHAAAETGRRITGFDYGAAFGRAAHRTKEAVQGVDADTFRASGHTMAKIGKTASGVQGFQDRRSSAEIKQICEDYASAAEDLTGERRDQLKERIDEFGRLRLTALHETLGKFLVILEALKQKNRAKEYELLDGIGIGTQAIESMGALDMTVSKTLGATAATGALGAAAVLGTPALVMGGVTAIGAASTGTAISTLSGAAASNAVLAWLGGGSLAAGGGGVAAGTAVLAATTATVTVGVALLAAGTILSAHYAQKLTEAKIHEEDVALAVTGLESAWIVMDGILRRVDELTGVTNELRERLMPLLVRLEGLVPVFDPADADHAAVFNQCGILIKTMVELAQVPLLGQDGELTDESLSVTVHVKNVLNTEV